MTWLDFSASTMIIIRRMRRRRPLKSKSSKRITT